MLRFQNISKLIPNHTIIPQQHLFSPRTKDNVERLKKEGTFEVFTLYHAVLDYIEIVPKSNNILLPFELRFKKEKHNLVTEEEEKYLLQRLILANSYVGIYISFSNCSEVDDKKMKMFSFFR